MRDRDYPALSSGRDMRDRTTQHYPQVGDRRDRDYPTLTVLHVWLGQKGQGLNSDLL